MRYQVFLSYVHKDQPWAREFANALRQFNIDVWFDFAEIGFGDDITQHIQQAIRESETLVVLLSENSESSQWMFAEIGAAIATGKKIIPIVIDDSNTMNRLGILGRYFALRESSATEAGRRIAQVINHQRTLSSASRILTGRATAIVVGVNSYHGLPPLSGSQNDALSMRAILEAQGASVRTLLSHDATRDSILASLSSAVRTMSDGDRLFFYFSGHGTDDEICPYDTAYGGQQSIRLEEIYSILDALPNCSCLLMFDVCNIGSSGEAFVHAAGPQAERIVISGTPSAMTSDDLVEVHRIFTDHVVKNLHQMQIPSVQHLTEIAELVQKKTLGRCTAKICDSRSPNKAVNPSGGSGAV